MPFKVEIIPIRLNFLPLETLIHNIAMKEKQRLTDSHFELLLSHGENAPTPYVITKNSFMKNLCILVLFSLISSMSFAQDAKEDVAVLQAAFGKEKEDLVKKYMAIPTELDAAFWSNYDLYEQERKALGREKIALIDEYVKSYETLDDKKAADLMARKLKLGESYGKMQKKYFDSFSKIIGGKNAAKFFQLEDYLENIIRLGIQESIPFIDELDASKVKSATK